MTSLPDATGILRLAYSGTYGGAKWANIFHARMTGGSLSGTDATALCTSLSTAWDTNLKAIHGTGVALTNVGLIDLTTTSSAQAQVSVNVAGTDGTVAAMPANIALVGSLKISRRYRGGHPRMYLTGQATGHTSTNVNWAGTWITTAGTALTNWRTAVNAITTTSSGLLTLGSLSYYSGNALRASPFFDVCTGMVVHSRIDTQRRRLGKELA